MKAMTFQMSYYKVQSSKFNHSRPRGYNVHTSMIHWKVQVT